MPLSTAQLKRTAKQMIRQSKPNVITVGAIYCILTIILSILSSRLINSGFTDSKYQWFLSYLENGSMDQAFRVLRDMTPSGGAVAIYLLLEASIAIVAVGFDIFLLRTIRGDSPSVGNLLDGFGFFWRILLINILIDLFVTLWGLLLIIPAIIASYSYSMATYLLIDHPEYSVMDCIRESKRMMRGHKMEFFLLQLSFIGWILLVQLSMLPGMWMLSALQLWTVPYISMTCVLYYEILRTGGVQPVLPGQDNVPPTM